jgi:hypothetical protein
MLREILELGSSSELVPVTLMLDKRRVDATEKILNEALIPIGIASGACAKVCVLCRRCLNVIKDIRHAYICNRCTDAYYCSVQCLRSTEHTCMDHDSLANLSAEVMRSMFMVPKRLLVKSRDSPAPQSKSNGGDVWSPTARRRNGSPMPQNTGMDCGIRIYIITSRIAYEMLVHDNRYCKVCLRNAKQCCAMCMSAYYCGTSCHKNDWQKHKYKCKDK